MIVKELHTDRLEQRYGKVSALVYEHDGLRRVIDIVDIQGTPRTHAVTWFPEITAESTLVGEDELRKEIKEGGLIGKTFKKHGFDIKKVPLADGVVVLPTWLKERFGTDRQSAAVNIYQFWGEKEGESFLYGVVCEINSPSCVHASEDIELSVASTQNSEYIEEYISRLKRYLLH